MRRFFGYFGYLLFGFVLLRASVLCGQSINMQNGVTTVVDTATPLTFYDSGGSGGNYQANDTRVHTFCPSDSDHYLCVRFFGYNITGDKAFLTIFDGTDTNAPPIVTLSYNYASTVSYWASSQPGGCLTFKFISDNGAVQYGWNAQFDCIPKAGINGPMWIQARDLNQNRNVGACTVSTCAGTYTDDGGAGAGYLNLSSQGGRAFCPDVPYSCLRVTSLSSVLPLPCSDLLNIRNGPNYINFNIWATSCGTETFEVTSAESSGCLTFFFGTQGLGATAGWVASFSCVPCAESGQTPTTPNDCINALPLALGCGQNSIYVNAPTVGPGIVSEGCQGCNLSEMYTRWYRLHTTTAGKVQFLLTPTLAAQNYDFALYGPFPSGGGCNDLEFPLRCSYSQSTGGGGIIGLSNSATTTSGGSGGGRILKNVAAQAGEDYLLMINKWVPGNFDFTLSVDNCQMDPQYACYDCMPLTVEVDGFTGRSYIGYNELNWQGIKETGIIKYTLEKLRGEEWFSLGNVKPTGDNSFYVATDYRPDEGANYYRLKTADLDGKESFPAGVVEVFANKGRPTFSAYYDASTETIALVLPTGYREENEISFYDATGRLIGVFPVPQKNVETFTTRFLLGPLSSGMYIAKIGSFAQKFWKP